MDAHKEIATINIPFEEVVRRIKDHRGKDSLKYHADKAYLELVKKHALARVQLKNG
jgi:hypothetical protein